MKDMIHSIMFIHLIYALAYGSSGRSWSAMNWVSVIALSLYWLSEHWSDLRLPLVCAPGWQRHYFFSEALGWPDGFARTPPSQTQWSGCVWIFTTTRTSLIQCCARWQSTKDDPLNSRRRVWDKKKWWFPKLFRIPCKRDESTVAFAFQ